VAGTERLEFEFERAGAPVGVRVELCANEDPGAHGCPEYARGFPVMRATIEPPSRGYQDMLGWIQVLDAPGAPELMPGPNLDALEMLAPVAEFTHPFGYFGFSPVFFDAPHRIPAADLDWVAHTFLAGIAGIYGEFEAHAYLGYSWGYRIRDGEVEVTGLTELGPDAWDADLPFLRRRCPTWTFAPGYRS